MTILTSALEGVQDTNNKKEFNGELVKKLHIAEKHIRKNKLKVGVKGTEAAHLV